MQRAIKFRAFDKEAKTMHKVSQIDFDYQFALLETSDGDYFQKHFRQIELMQFTGLYDKHGKEIYEGDIVKPISLNIIFKVIEWKGAFKLLANELDNKDDLRPAHRMLDSGEFEIIGNIYENPELLK